MRAVVGEDQLLTREGIVTILGRVGVDVVGEAGDVDELMAVVERERPDVVLLDIRMPPTHTDEGLQASALIRQRWPASAILILSQYVEVDFVVTLLEGSAKSVGYLIKDRVLEIATLADALRRVAAGECVVDPLIVRELMTRQRRTDPLGALSDREREVLALMAEGLSNRAIAQRLFITERTVEVHTSHVFMKLNLPDDDLANRRVLAALTYLRSV
jgi:DNA-binding NarL/FixJ family response regulator